jgi:hypothetical protein
MKVGQPLTKLELDQISKDYSISKHALQRMKERGLNPSEIPSILRNPYSSFLNTDDSVNVAKDSNHYLVFAKDRKNPEKWILITYKEKSKNNVSFERKQFLALMGLGRLRNF